MAPHAGKALMCSSLRSARTSRMRGQSFHTMHGFFSARDISTAWLGLDQGLVRVDLSKDNDLVVKEEFLEAIRGLVGVFRYFLSGEAKRGWRLSGSFFVMRLAALNSDSRRTCWSGKGIKRCNARRYLLERTTECVASRCPIKLAHSSY
jgi:hypothetical protein